MLKRPKISIVIPIHAGMKHGDYFLWRSIQAIMRQTFKDYEIVISQDGTMPVNTNAGMNKARGELIKILYLDDYLAHDNALQEIVDAFGENDHWLVTGCLHQKYEPEYYEDAHSPHYPLYSKDIHTGNNTIGSPSVLTLRNEGHLSFDERLSWVLDCELYRRYYDTYGPPEILNDLNVVMGIHDGQTSQTMPQSKKLLEHEYVNKKYV